jgi:nitrate reductase NapE
MRPNRPEASPGSTDDVAYASRFKATAETGAKRREITMFLVLAFAIWPILAVAVVGGYGFIVWMFQTIMGPPGPPAV